MSRGLGGCRSIYEIMLGFLKMLRVDFVMILSFVVI